MITYTQCNGCGAAKKICVKFHSNAKKTIWGCIAYKVFPKKVEKICPKKTKFLD